MRFNILGPLIAETDNGTPVVLPRPSQRSTLAVLLVHADQPPSRTALIDALWGDEPPADAHTALRVRMSDLRRALAGCDRLVTHSSGYRILIRPGELDAVTFGGLAARGRASLDTGGLEDAASTLAEALTLWRSPPLADLPDTPSMQFTRTSLLEQRRDVHEWLIDARLALGQHRESLAEIRGCIAADPLAEHAHVQLMVALYGCGQKSAALAAYTRLRDLTVREFGQDPGPEARALLDKMLADSPDLAAPARPAGAQPTAPERLAGGTPANPCRSATAWTRNGTRPGPRGIGRLCQARHRRPA